MWYDTVYTSCRCAGYPHLTQSRTTCPQPIGYPHQRASPVTRDTAGAILRVAYPVNERVDGILFISNCCSFDMSMASMDLMDGLSGVRNPPRDPCRWRSSRKTFPAAPVLTKASVLTLYPAVFLPQSLKSQ